MTLDSVVEIVFQLDEVPGSKVRRCLESRLDRCEGIVSVSFTTENNPMVVVKYDTRLVHAKDVLNLLGEECCHARLLFAF